MKERKTKSYLIKQGYDDLIKVTIVEVTEKAIKVAYENWNSRRYTKEEAKYRSVVEEL